MQFLILQLMCMLLVSYDLFVTNYYSQNYYMLQQKFLGTLIAWHPTLSNSGLYDHLALLSNVQYTSPMGFKALKFCKNMRSYKSVAYLEGIYTLNHTSTT